MVNRILSYSKHLSYLFLTVFSLWEVAIWNEKVKAITYSSIVLDSWILNSVYTNFEKRKFVSFGYAIKCRSVRNHGLKSTRVQLWFWHQNFFKIFQTDPSVTNFSTPPQFSKKMQIHRLFYYCLHFSLKNINNYEPLSVCSKTQETEVFEKQQKNAAPRAFQFCFKTAKHC